MSAFVETVSYYVYRRILLFLKRCPSTQLGAGFAAHDQPVCALPHVVDYPEVDQGCAGVDQAT